MIVDLASNCVGAQSINFMLPHYRQHASTLYNKYYIHVQCSYKVLNASLSVYLLMMDVCKEGKYVVIEIY